MTSYSEYFITNDEKRSNYYKNKRYPTYADGKSKGAEAFKLRRRDGDITVFTTRTSPDSKLRNAVLGTYYHDRVGSIQEYKYFKISLATGEVGWDTNHLYYECPEEYEAHFRCKLSEDIKQEWRERNGLNYLPMEDEKKTDSCTESSYDDHDGLDSYPDDEAFDDME